MENRNCIFYITTMLNKFFLYIVVDDLSESKKKRNFLRKQYYTLLLLFMVQCSKSIGILANRRLVITENQIPKELLT